MSSRDSSSTPVSPISFWTAGCLILIIVGSVLYFTNPSTQPILVAFRSGLVGAGLLGLIIISLVSRGKGPDSRALAREILGQQKSLYGAPHEHVPANTEEFIDLDRGYYEQIQKFFESEKFRYLEDVENVTLSRAYPALRTFERTMIGDNDGVIVRISQILPLGRVGRDIRNIELTSEFSDFTFLVTTNAEILLDTDTGGVKLNRLRLNTGPAELLSTHRASLIELQAKKPGVTVVKCPTLDAVLKSARRQHAVHSVHRKRNGYVTESDMKLIRGEPLTDLDRKIFEEINQLEAQERSAAESSSD